MCSPFIDYHRDADGNNGERFRSSSLWGESAGPGAVVNENVGRSLEIAFDSISDPSGGVRRKKLRYNRSRATSWLFLFYSLTHVRIIDSHIHAAAIVALLLLRDALARDDEIK